MKKFSLLGTIIVGVALCSAPISFSLGPTKLLSASIDTANARIGRPLTPFSVAGVNRRVHRRAYYRAAGAYGYGGYGGYGYGGYGGYGYGGYGGYGYGGLGYGYGGLGYGYGGYGGYGYAGLGYGYGGYGYGGYGGYGYAGLGYGYGGYGYGGYGYGGLGYGLGTAVVVAAPAPVYYPTYYYGYSGCGCW